METILNRIAKIAECESISITAMEAIIGASKGVLSRALSNNTDIQSKWIVSLVENYQQYSAEWLLTGKGSMFRAVADAQPSAVAGVGIPLVGIKAVGGFGNSDFAIHERDIKEHYIIPKFKHKQVDFMIEVEGSSMYPKYSSGDVVACRIIKESSFIQWNKAHVVSTQEQGIIIKRIKQGSTAKSLIMVSDNKDYPPFEVQRKEITGIALVVGVIRLE